MFFYMGDGTKLVHVKENTIMYTPKKSSQKDNDKSQSKTTKGSISTDAVEEDGSPVLDEKDLEENHLTVEEADNIIWDDQEPMEDVVNSGENGEDEE